MNLSQLFSIFTAAGQAPTASSYIMTFVPLALILVFFYFFIIKPQKKQEKQAQLVIKWIFGILLLLAFIFLIVSSL